VQITDVDEVRHGVGSGQNRYCSLARAQACLYESQKSAVRGLRPEISLQRSADGFV
jgi:hypothetical protein